MKLTGLPLVVEGDAHSSSSVQQHPLGAVSFDQIGRMYRYVKAGASNLVVGNLLQSPARDTAFTDMAVPSAVAAGAYAITVTLGGTSTTANMFDNGILSITVTPGGGQQFTIRSHQVATNGTSCTFYTYEPVVTALTTSSKVTVRQNHYNGVIQSPTTRTGKTVGVAIYAIPASNYGWIGVRGSFGVLSDATVAAVGEGIAPSTTTAGSVTKAVTLLERIGTADVLGISAKWEPVTLELP